MTRRQCASARPFMYVRSSFESRSVGSDRSRASARPPLPPSPRATATSTYRKATRDGRSFFKRGVSFDGSRLGRIGSRGLCRTRGGDRRTGDGARTPAACTAMILTQVHLRKPCYDFYFLEVVKFVSLSAGGATRTPHATGSPWASLNHSIGSSDGRCVQRAGTDSPRADDSRVQGIPR